MADIGIADIAIVVILLLTVGAAVVYIVKAKKNGAKCIGCPMAGSCSQKSSSSGCSCGCDGNSESQYSCHADTKE